MYTYTHVCIANAGASDIASDGVVAFATASRHQMQKKTFCCCCLLKKSVCRPYHLKQGAPST